MAVVATFLFSNEGTAFLLKCLYQAARNMYMYVDGIDSVSTSLLLNFGTVPTVRYFSFFILL